MRRGGRTPGEGVWWSAAAIAAALGAAFLWRENADSVRTTWLGVAAGAESIRGLTAIAVWEGMRDAIVPRSPIPFHLAAAGVPHGLWLAALVVAWAGGARRLAGALGAGPVPSGIAGVAAALLVVAASDGRHAVLEAAGFPWLVAGLVRGRGAASLVLPAAALGLLSPDGIRLALPILVAGALLQRGEGTGPVLAAGVAAALLFAVPDPDWARVLRFEATHVLDEGAYAWPPRPPGEVLGALVAGEAPVARSARFAAIALLAAAGAGAVRAGARGAAAGSVAVALLGVALGGDAPGGAIPASPASMLALVFPAARLHAVPEVATAIAGAILAALAARAPAAGGLALACLVPVLVAGRPDGRMPLAVPAATAAAVAAGRGDALALPLALANDRRWREALPGERRLRNGTQPVLAANAPLVARVLEEGDAETVRATLARLGLARAVVPAGPGGPERIVDLAPRAPDRSGPCLPAAGWTLRSSVGNPAVSVPERALDGDPATRWGTGEPQRPGQFFEIDFGSAVRLRALELGHEAFAGDFPRGFRAFAAGGRGPWREVVVLDPWLGEPRWRDGFLVESREGRVRVPLGGRRVRRVRIELTRTSELHDWSIATLCAVPAHRRAAR